jgi:uncharacterized protein (TIGR00369 family)
MDVASAQSLVDSTDFGPWWGFRVESVGDGVATVRLPFRQQLLRPAGRLHGACAMALADVAFWLAATTRVGDPESNFTLEMKTNFLRPGATDLLTTARVLRAGRRVVFGDAQTVDEAGELVAHHTLTYLRG